MALLPRALRPAAIIRRKAIWSGLLGNSQFWRTVALGMVGRSMLRKMFGKEPDTVSVETVGPNNFVAVMGLKPLTRKQARQQGVSKVELAARASADVAAAWAAKAAATPSGKKVKRKVAKRADKTARMAAADRAKADKKRGKRAS